MLIAPDGTIVAGGKTVSSLINFDPNNVEIAIARYTANGQLDLTFNHTGEAIFSLTGAAVTQSLTAPAGVQEQADFLGSASLTPFDASSDLMAAFMQLTQSDEGVIASTLGGELLDVANNGGDTVEAKVLTATWDLADAVTTAPPLAVVGGGKGKTSVSISDVETNSPPENIRSSCLYPTRRTWRPGLRRSRPSPKD